MQPIRKVIGKAAAALLLLLAVFVVFPASAASPKKKFVVVIDAGHGGKDPGSVENGVNEKDVNLAVALKLGDMIKKKLKDTQVIYTRDKDEFISLQGRADVANKNNADIFISIHCNSVDPSNKNRSIVAGATTYTLGASKTDSNFEVTKRENKVAELDDKDNMFYASYDPNKEDSFIIYKMTQNRNIHNSKLLAGYIQKEMEAADRISRGVNEAGFYVLWSTSMPAVLVELDFLCNPEQAQFLKSDKGQQKLAGAIFNAVKTYENYYRKSMGNLAAHEVNPASPLPKVEENVEEDVAAFSTVTYQEDSHVNSPSTRGRRHRASGSDSAPAASSSASASSSSSSTRSSASSSTRSSSKASSSTSTASGRRRNKKKALPQPPVEEAVIPFVQEVAATPEPQVQPVVATAVTDDSADSKSKKGKNAKKEKKQQEKDKKKTAKRAGGSGVSPYFIIVLFSSDKELKPGDAALHGLAPSYYEENNLFYYYIGQSKSNTELQPRLLELREDFPEARIIQRYM